MGTPTIASGGRRHRTLLITDIVRSTELVARLGDSRWRELIERHGTLVEDQVRRCGGTIVSDRGDGFLIAFEPAAPAINCAEQLCLGSAALGLEVRAGLHAGECELLGRQLAGLAVHIAARISELAGPSEVFVSSVVRDLLRGSPVRFVERGVRDLRGVPRPWAVYALDSEALVRAHADAAAEAGDGVDGAAPSAGAGHGLPIPLPPVAAVRLRESHLADRSAELGRCLDAARRARAGDQRMLLIAGEPGIGKSRLTAEVAGRLHGEGMTVLWGRCDAELGVPYQPFVEILTHLARFAAHELIARHRSQFGAELARLVPELGGSLPSLPALSEQSQREENRHVMFAAVAGLLHDASLTRPLVLVLEDLHWADKPTLLLLKYLQVTAEPIRALLIGTYRSTEKTPHEVLDVRLTELRREHGVELIALGGLPAQAAVEMAEHVAEERLAGAGAELIHSVWEQAHGNPFFVGEVVRSLREAGGVTRAAQAQAGGARSFAVPYSIRETIADRVARMGAEAETILSAAAVLGTEFDVELLVLVCDVAQETLVQVLDDATRAALIAEVPGLGMRFAFVHDLIAVALYEQLGGGRRRLLHCRALAGLEQLLGEDARRLRIGELAHHALGGVPLVAAAAALEYSRQAGEQALAQLAPQEAMRWFEQALALHERPGAVADRDERERLRCDLLVGRGIAQEQSGDPQFRSTLLEASRLARTRGDGERLVRAALANTRGFASETGRLDAERIEMLEAALEFVGTADSPERARLLSLLSAELTFSGDWPRRKQLSDESLGIARRLEDPATLIAVLGARFITIWTPETLAERRADTELALSLAEHLGDSLGLLRAIHWKAAAAVEAGELELAGELVERQTRLATRLRHPTGAWLAAYDRATQALMRGLLEEAERSAEDARDVALQSEQPEAIAFYAGQLLNIRFEQGRLHELEPLVAQQVALNPGIPAFRGALALARSEAGMREEALEVLAVDSASDFSELPYDSNWLVGMAIYAQVCASLDDADAAAKLWRLLSPWRAHVAFNSATTWGSVERHLGNLERVLGRLDEAEASLLGAAAAHERMGAPIWLARTRLDLARVVLERGGDAAPLLEQAERTARDLGCASIERQAGMLLPA